MEMLVLGHAGARMLVFPTSQGRYFEWEDRGMGAALARQLQNGWLQMFCVDSVDAESWYDRGKWPGDRAWRHELYDRYLHDEVLPFTSHRNPNPYLIATGASLGAYHAVNFAFRHPHLVSRTVALSGLYDIKRLTRGYSDDNVYYNDPSHFILHEHDSQRLDALRRIDIILAVGRDDPNIDNNRFLSQALWDKGIANSLHVWDGWNHDWPWWRDMIRMYIAGS
jgi:esterase/lipase superfamily enzyme